MPTTALIMRRRISSLIVPNRPPTFSATQYVWNIGDETQTCSFCYTIVASDPDGDPIKYSKAGTWPPQFTMNEEGIISYLPMPAAVRRSRPANTL